MAVMPLGDLNAFVAVSAAVAFVGRRIVYLASRIERQRQERDSERYGGHALPPLKPAAWIRFMNSKHPSPSRQQQ
jgi:hypothetical protein